MASFNSDNAMVKKLLSAKANVSATDDQGHTALSVAARHDATHIVKRLLSAKANVRTRDKQGKTALYWAVHFGYESRVNTLRNASAIE